jgi:DNA-binding MarR family transcriptional regulator
MPSELVAPAPRAATTTPASSPVAPDDPRLGAWRSFIHAHARLTRTLDEEMQAAHGLSLAEYDALLQLVNAPGRRLRMSALADRVLLSRSGITRLVDRLVAAGWVERTACTTDARGAEASLTPAGLDKLRAASRTHLAGVGRLFLDVVDPADRAAMERGLDRVLANLGASPLAEADCTPGTGRA